MALPDDLWETAVRFRLDLRSAAFAAPPPILGQCHHCTRGGARCTKQLDSKNVHAVHCATGGGTQARHDALGRTLGAMVQDVLQVKCQFEQRTPQLDRFVHGEMERAILDVVYQDPDLGM